MNANSILFGAGIVTLVLQTVTLIGLIWRGGRWSQSIESDVKAVAANLERTVKQLDDLEHRVGHLEGRK